VKNTKEEIRTSADRKWGKFYVCWKNFVRAKLVDSNYPLANICQGAKPKLRLPSILLGITFRSESKLGRCYLSPRGVTTSENNLPPHHRRQVLIHDQYKTRSNMMRKRTMKLLRLHWISSFVWLFSLCNALRPLIWCRCCGFRSGTGVGLGVIAPFGTC